MPACPSPPERASSRQGPRAHPPPEPISKGYAAAARLHSDHVGVLCCLEDVRVVAVGVLAAKLVHLPSTLFVRLGRHGQANMSSSRLTPGRETWKKGVQSMYSMISSMGWSSLAACFTKPLSLHHEGLSMPQTLMHKLPTNFLARDPASEAQTLFMIRCESYRRQECQHDGFGSSLPQSSCGFLDCA